MEDGIPETDDENKPLKEGADNTRLRGKELLELLKRVRIHKWGNNVVGGQRCPTEVSDEVPTELVHEVPMEPSVGVPTEPSVETEAGLGVVAVAAAVLRPCLTSDTKPSNVLSLYRRHIYPEGVMTWTYYQQENGTGQQGQQAPRMMDSPCRSWT